ncbi:MAG: hypothetical protein KGJ55_00120 [Gammaproteobacteria bacterium]|nr:hypothetical protein [Gammaproteobacteria bacterium]
MTAAANSEIRRADTAEDWRLLRAVALYRLVLVLALLGLQEIGTIGRLFPITLGALFHDVCIAYALVALLLVAAVVAHRPASARQIPISLGGDTVAIAALTGAAGGVGSGIGMLLILPVVGYALLSGPRLALAYAALATSAMFAEELWRGSGQLAGGDATETGILGLILFSTTGVASLIATRTRRSEALARRVGSDLLDLTQLNERILERMETGVLVVDGDRVRTANLAARTLLHHDGDLRGARLSELAPALAATLAAWRADPSMVAPLLRERPGAPELSARFMPLGQTSGSSALLLLDPAERLREQAQQIKLAALGRLSASIAHEIRNPLSAIRQAGQLLAESPTLDEAERQLLTVIERQSRRLDRIIADVLSLSRREPPHIDRLTLATWLEREIDRYLEGQPKRAGRLHMDVLEPTLVVHFDQRHLQQVLHNLWNNSFEHGTRAQMVVTVRMSAGRLAGSSAIYLDIADDGPGIAAEMREKIFEPFFTTAHDGTGLGLYLSRELCDYNHARLLLRRTQGAGACFRLLFAPVVVTDANLDGDATIHANVNRP